MMPDCRSEDVGEHVETLRIMLLGKSGAGKSSSGNTILGKQAFKSDMKLTRVTQHCEKEEGLVGNVPVAVIDTPGLFETDFKKDDVREILKCVRLQDPGPHAFVFVVPLGRMTMEDQDTNAVIEKMFGPRVWDYTVVLFTHGDRLEGKTINDIISDSDENLRNFLRKCSGGFHVFNNKKPEDQDHQVGSFLEKVQTLMALNARRHYHTELYPEKERRIRERQASILKERETEIGREERMLQERHQGDDLEKKRKELWRREEDKARRDAEKQTGRSLLVPLLVLALLALLVAWAVATPGALVLLLAGASVAMVMSFQILPFVSGNFPGVSKKKE